MKLHIKVLKICNIAVQLYLYSCASVIFSIDFKLLILTSIVKSLCINKNVFLVYMIEYIFITYLNCSQCHIAITNILSFNYNFYETVTETL